MTSSMGRLFDAVASLIHLCHFNRYEGEAAIRLEELAASKNPETDVYPFHVHRDKAGAHVMDWRPMIRAILDHMDQKRPVEHIAVQFHRTLIEMTCWVAHQEHQNRVLLSGGSFQNRILTEGITSRLTREGYSVRSHYRLPPNDGGLSVGQIVAGSWYYNHRNDR
jgi:hydrogenase maturation protein HypF